MADRTGQHQQRFASSFEVDLPTWAVEANRNLPNQIIDLETRMRTVIEFSSLNVRHGTGGPFAAGVFEKETGKVVVVGVNRVLPTNVSSAHAEIVALSLAQSTVGHFDLGADLALDYQLVVSARPCAMCLGAVLWSGIVDLVIGASGEQVERITGFDEGPIHPDWRNELASRNISLVENLIADEACAVLNSFAESDAVVYNARRGR